MTSPRPASLTIYVDGSSRGNPGPSGIGVVVFSSSHQTKSIKEISKYIGVTTNNVAEYEAVIHALKLITTLDCEHATIKVDSELVYKQLAGKYKVRTPRIATQLKRIQMLKSNVKELAFELIPRTENKLANRLAQKASKKVKITKKTFKQNQLSEQG